MRPHPSNLGRRRRAAPRRGVSTLVVVMVLFFLVAMVAAYTNRSLIFDQRTASNQLRASQAFAAAEAGAEWALAQLNAGLIDNTCSASTTADDDAHRSMRDRFLQVTASNFDTGLHEGTVGLRLNSDGTLLFARCVFDGQDTGSLGWNCTCDQADVTPTAPSRPVGGKPAPAFSVNFSILPFESSSDLLAPTAVRIAVVGCSQVTNCFDLSPGADSGSSISRVGVTVALRPALRTQPAAPLTLGGTLAALPAGGFAGGASVRLVNNPMVATSVGKTAPSIGMTVVAGGTVNAANLIQESMPGTPGSATRVENDASLTLPAITAADFPPSGLTSRDRSFVATFGMAPGTYGRQPAIVRMTCAAGSPCTAAAVKTAIERHPGHAVWLAGPGGLTLNADLGESNDDPAQPSARGPVMLIVEGPVTASNNAVVWGVIYGRNADWSWTVDGPVTINGALIAEGNVSVAAGGAPPQLLVDYSGAHAAGVFNFLRGRAGSYSRLSKGWRDWYN